LKKKGMSRFERFREVTNRTLRRSSVVDDRDARESIEDEG